MPRLCGPSSTSFNYTSNGSGNPPGSFSVTVRGVGYCLLVDDDETDR